MRRALARVDSALMGSRGSILVVLDRQGSFDARSHQGFRRSSLRADLGSPMQPIDGSGAVWGDRSHVRG
jgi:hypothetical protein